MSLTASLQEPFVTAVPGEETSLPLRVLNSGDTVEEYRFEVVGACAAWATVEPAALSLYPGSSESATLTLRPPRDPSVPAGETPFGVRVVPTSGQGEPVVPEGRVIVLPFTEVTAELVPNSSHGALRGRHQLAVDNRGNTPIAVRLGSRSGTERARVSFNEPELRIEPGRAEFGGLRITPVKRLWWGTPVTHPFQALVTPAAPEGVEAPDPVVLDGSYQQEALLPRWLPRAAVITALLVVALIGLWYALLRPAVKSAAREAITPEAIASATAQGMPTPGGEADSGANSGASGEPGASPGSGTGTSSGTSSGASSGANSGATGGPSPSPSPSPSDGSSAEGSGEPAPTSAQLQVRDSVGGGSNTAAALEVPDGKTFRLTDIVIQNPQGDAGTVTVSAGESGTVLSLALENFRDSDYHFVTPILVPEGGQVTMTVNCRKVGKPVNAPTPSRCAESLFLGGTMQSGDDREN
ncbi:hypothetical protein GCM10010387_26930 [Streptomyces inusitatus]|uniref:Hydrolytic protein n=1 Tax=Streptomyces inusitatus TaxID=68221 RepID=A0A918Q2H5_9ACTN|nr:hypothetical protein [Streptomyces inusitatus]GGZ31554.1 hypothetical protein GCM10010387_26930 [Streptomyces inusitatus]